MEGVHVRLEGLHKSPLVSVVLMAYKRPEYLRITMASVLEQTMSDFELIVADNSNSPEIARMCTEFNDERIRYIGNEITLPMVSNAKLGMRLAQGKYIANIHDDDVIDAKFLETLILPMERDEHVGLVFCDHTIIDADGTENMAVSDYNSKAWGRAHLTEGVLIDRVGALFNQVIPAPSGRVFRTGSIDLDEIYEEVGYAYDWWMSFLHCKSAFDCYYVPARLMSYRVHGGSASSSGTLKQNENLMFILGYFLTHQSFPEKKRLIQKKLVKSSLSVAKCHLLLGDNAAARGVAMEAFRLTENLRCLMAYLLACLPSHLTGITLKMALPFLRKR